MHTGEFLGADTEALAALGDALGAAGDALDGILGAIEAIGRAIGDGCWTGPDADAMVARLAAVSQSMRAVADALVLRAAEATGHAEEQDAASGADAAGIAAAAPAVTDRVGTAPGVSARNDGIPWGPAAPAMIADPDLLFRGADTPEERLLRSVRM
ncbi:hypothetical protein [Brachybacterium huguangmaarense]